MQPPVVFISHSHQLISNSLHLLGVSILSYCISSRSPSFISWKQWSNLTWGRICVILVLIDSWIFVFFTGVLVNGVGLSYSHTTCALAIYTCITFYALSKILIYGFLVEKVYIVWSGGNHTPRFATPAYRICSVVLLGYVAVVVLMVLGKNSFIRSDGVCVIGLRNYATIAVITYDLLLNIFLTTMFLWPLWRSKLISHRLRNIATRTLYGAFASLTTSAVNMAILVILRGQEFGWLCLGSCVTDVTLNAIVLSWVSAGSYSHHQHSNITFDRFSLPTMDVGPLVLAVGSEPGQAPSSGFPRGPSSGAVPYPASGGPGIGKEGSTMTAGSAELDLPESFYDYIPREDRRPALGKSKSKSGVEDAGTAGARVGDGIGWKGWLGRFGRGTGNMMQVHGNDNRDSRIGLSIMPDTDVRSEGHAYGP